ncbi:MAG: zf-HC2 domain-containing protein, partial [Acidobacteria bacterium]|nr:zf-HC2 domain-containing protein [Acidobacteriota bacterium]
MISKRYQPLLRQTWHPSEDELLFYLDGETDASSNARVEAHLKSCWACRVKREKMDRLISAFMESRKASLGSCSNAPPGVLFRLETQLDRLDSEMVRPPLFSRMLDSLRQTYALSHLSLRWVMLVAASVCVLLVLIRLSSAPSVSAKEVLERSERAQAQRIRQVPTPVIYQKVRVRRSSLAARPEETVTWETWSDRKGNRFRQRVEDATGPRFVPLRTNQPKSLHSNSPLAKGARGLSSTDAEPSSLPPVLAELQQILEANRIDPQRPLSPAAYATWRSSIQTRSEEVSETQLPEGEKALTIRTEVAGPFAPNSIVEAEYMVRVEDWHPVTQRFRVQREKGIQSFELTETAFQVLALNTLPAAIFADLSPPAPPKVIPQESIAPSTHAPSTAELLAAEIEAHYALHRVKACLGEPIEV